ncbi:MAG: hypothetical protein ACC612_10625 [Methanomethylovorans sp.]|uniref:hypothetical protein n=1 Tax=Methanomethylovorans sp. TaxID=2758717 RepID=UPI0035312D43
MSSENHSLSKNTENSFPTVQVEIRRIRYFLEFENPAFLKVREEITLYYPEKASSPEFIPYIAYEVHGRRAGLHFYDDEGNILEFVSFESDDLKDLREKLIEKSDFSPADVVQINFKNPFKMGTYRTIFVEYIYANSQSNIKITQFLYRKSEGANTYIFIKHCDNYILHIAHDEEMELECVEESKFCELFSTYSHGNGDYYIEIKHKSPKWLSRWYNVGGFFSTVVALSIPFSYHYNRISIDSNTVLASVSISFLLIIKGWLFQNKMDAHLRIYDKMYLMVIIVLLSEIILMKLDYIVYNITSLHLPMYLYNLLLYYYLVY